MNSERLNDADELALLKLANRLHELPGNPIVQHEWMLKELCQMTGASAGVSALLDAPPRQAANILFLVSHGLHAPQQQSAINRYMRALEAPLTAPESLIRLLEFRDWENHNGHLEEDEIRWIHDLRELCRPLNFALAIFSTLPLPGTRLISILSIHRALNDTRACTPRERSLVELFHSQIGWTFRVPQPAEPGAAARLSPRQQQTLRHLLAGDSEKQIAEKLSRSPHTVHTYVKAIYRNFRVSSRGELLSLFVK